MCVGSNEQPTNEKPNMNAELFKNDVAEAVRNYVRKARREGTTAIGTDCLWQCVAGRWAHDNEPRGTNCAWVARQTFNEVIGGTEFRRFIL